MYCHYTLLFERRHAADIALSYCCHWTDHLKYDEIKRSCKDGRHNLAAKSAVPLVVLTVDRRTQQAAAHNPDSTNRPDATSHGAISGPRPEVESGSAAGLPLLGPSAHFRRRPHGRMVQ
jgi:hypothetical protein